jgi:hypothetical protein
MSQLLTPATLEDVMKPIPSKKTSDFSKTQKNTNKISAILKTLQEMDDDDTANLGDFSPPPKPISVGSVRTTENPEDSPTNYAGYRPPRQINGTTTTSDGLELNNLKFNYPEPSSIDTYYQKYLPNSANNASKTEGFSTAPSILRGGISNTQVSASASTKGLPSSASSVGGYNDSALTEKLNYMIHLLEDKQDVKSANKFEELLLYCLLGVFTIFLVDSFTKVGKYVR